MWYNREHIIIDGNKLILMYNYEGGISSEIIHLIVLFGINILVIRNANFNSKLENIPESVMSIKVFSCKFSQSLENLPERLKFLSIGPDDDCIECDFNEKLDCLPSTIESLSFNCENIVLDQADIAQLPPRLKKLKIECDNFDTDLDYLPAGLEHLTIISSANTRSMSNLPPGLQYLKIVGYQITSENISSVNCLPDSIKYLEFISYDTTVPFTEMSDVRFRIRK